MEEWITQHAIGAGAREIYGPGAANMSSVILTT